jgi:hypothetical protein
MYRYMRNGISGVLAVMALSCSLNMPALSQTIHKGYVGQNHAKVRSYFYRHPKVKAATVGAGVGTAAGAVAGLVSGRGVVRGALIGAGTGAGVGLIRSSQVMKRHPIVRDTATGVAAGLGLGLVSRGHHSAVKGAAVGGAVGLGLGAIKQYVH